MADVQIPLQTVSPEEIRRRRTGGGNNDSLRDPMTGGGNTHLPTTASNVGLSPEEREMHQQPGIGATLSFKDLDRQSPAWPVSKGPIILYNHTKDLLQDWTFWSGLAICTFVIITTFVYSVLVAFTYASFPSSDPIDVFSRSVFVFGIVYMLILSFWKHTGAYMISSISLFQTILYLIFDDSKDKKRRNIILELLKLVIIIICQNIGTVLGTLFFALPAQTGAVSTDCGANLIAACDARPELTGTTTGGGIWMMLISGSLIYGAYALGHTLHGDDRKHENWIIAQLVAFAYFTCHLIFGRFTKGGFNFMYWFWLNVWAEQSFSDATVYTWPFLIGVIFVFLCCIIHYWARNRVNRNQSSIL